MIFVFDLDGTLCNIEHRLHYIQNKPKNWPAFYRACVDDVPVLPILHCAQALVVMGHRVEIWSGRSDEVRAETEAWLNCYPIGYSVLRMRREGDYRADDIVKGEWLDALPPEQRPALAFDDRQRMVDMWRSRGVQCAQVAPGQF